MPESLKKLLEQVRAAEPNDRIPLFRNAVAAHGAPAIDALVPWLDNPELATFAVRTIARAGATGHRAAAVEALRAVPADAPRRVLSEVDEALSGLGTRRLRPSKEGPASTDDEINDDLYSYLVGRATVGELTTYTEAGDVVELTMRNPNHRRVIGEMLGRISTREDELGRPMLSSIVVNKDAKSKLGDGFYKLAEELRHKDVGEDPDSFAKAEIAKTFDFWQSQAQPLAPRASVTGAPDYRSRGPNEDPPPAMGGCDFSGATGRCQNPGRWDRNGHLSCTTHALARSPQLFNG